MPIRLKKLNYIKSVIEIEVFHCVERMYEKKLFFFVSSCKHLLAVYSPGNKNTRLPLKLKSAVDAKETVKTNPSSILKRK